MRVAVDRSRSSTAAGSPASVESASSKTAIAPETCGVAIEVPESVLVVSVPRLS